MTTPAEEFGDLITHALGGTEQTDTTDDATTEEPAPRVPKPNAAQGTSGGTPAADPSVLFTQEIYRRLRW